MIKYGETPSDKDFSELVKSENCSFIPYVPEVLQISGSITLFYDIFRVHVIQLDIVSSVCTIKLI